MRYSTVCAESNRKYYSGEVKRIRASLHYELKGGIDMSSAGCQCSERPCACTTEFEYAVKVVCGTVTPSPTAVPTPVAPGRYWTAINIHNPDKCRNATFRWKVVVAPTLNQTPAATPQFQRPRTLRPDEAVEIDCQNVIGAISPPPPFIKGYVVVESNVELDVVAVYTAAQSSTAPLNTFHTERVQPRCVPVCEDLVLPLHTGIADWQTVAPAPTGPVVILSGLNSNWAPAPFGSSWVSQLASDSSTATPTPPLRIYRLCFDLCFGFQPPAQLQIQGLADDSAQVFLNGGSIGTISGFSTPTTINVTSAMLQGPNGLQAGNNCFEVRVPNIAGPKINPTGFALAGLLTVLRGKCPCSRIPLAAHPPAGAIPIEENGTDNPNVG
jgi:hypothetical protein